MRAVIQRVSEASVTIGGSVHAETGAGLLIFLGIAEDDAEEDIAWLSAKLVNLRIFSDENGLMNRSILDESGEILLVSQFTLHASTKKGNRPSFIQAARPPLAEQLYEQMIVQLSNALGRQISTGEFGADMQVKLVNDGPVTILIDSRNRE